MCYYIECLSIIGGEIMSPLEYVVGAVVILVSLAIIFIVLFQQGRRAGINGVISGGADTFLSKTKARTWDAKLARMTKYFAIAFFVLAIIANVIALGGK